MKLKNGVIYLILISIITSLICLFNFNKSYAITDKKTSIYMWEVNDIDYETYDKMVDYLNINKIYAYIGTANINNKIDSEVTLLFEFAERKNIDLYIVYDENYEDQTVNANRIKELIQEVKQYNESSNYKIKGIAIDSEFHTLDGYSSLSKEEQIDLFADYVNAMKLAYESANQANIEYVVCIPVWLDKLDKDQLEELIKNGCSYVQLMNYSKSNMINNIKDEVDFAKKYSKKIENIAELQIPGPHGVTDNETFYNDGLEACNQKFKEIDDTYNYEQLTFSYHYYKPVIELYNKLDLNNNINNNEENNEKNNDQIGENNQKDSNESDNEGLKSNDENKTDLNNKDNNIPQIKDDSVAKGVIPQTGENEMLLIPIIIVLIFIAMINILKIKRINKKNK